MHRKHLTISKTHSWLKITQQSRNRRELPPLWYTTFTKNPTINIIFNVDKLGAFHLRSGTNKDAPLTTPIHHHSRRPSICNKAGQVNKGLEDWEEKKKFPLFIDDMIAYVKHTKKLTTKTRTKLVIPNASEDVGQNSYSLLRGAERYSHISRQFGSLNLVYHMIQLLCH